GTAPLDQELKTFEQLVTALPTAATLRLDANGGLTLSEAEAWLAQCDRLPEGRIDCLEQPLPVGQFPEMLLLQQRHRTTLGLDESVASVAQLERCLMNGWQGVVVIKAAIAGFPSHLRQVCQRHGADIIWSSVFETAVARRYAFHHLIPAQPSRALGYGTGHWFTDGWDSLAPDQLWSRL
ncbi:MAG: enolase C-terminal domain-like protein, partial [Cyanobacteria bacterium P01_A01_bin.135]